MQQSGIYFPFIFFFEFGTEKPISVKRKPGFTVSRETRANMTKCVFSDFLHKQKLRKREGEKFDTPYVCKSILVTCMNMRNYYILLTRIHTYAKICYSHAYTCIWRWYYLHVKIFHFHAHMCKYILFTCMCAERFLFCGRSEIMRRKALVAEYVKPRKGALHSRDERSHE